MCYRSCLLWCRSCLSHHTASSAVYRQLFVFGESTQGWEVQHHTPGRQVRQAPAKEAVVIVIQSNREPQVSVE